MTDGICNEENMNKICRYDGGDCCNHQKVQDGICDVGNLNHWCNFDGELNDCSCDYENLTRDGLCNPTNNKSICLFDDYDCLCPDSSLVNGVYVDCTGKILIS